MTRITNFGRKRTFMEAGFTQDQPEPSTSTTTLSQKPQPELQQTSDVAIHEISQGPSIGPPPKKKRKRTPKSKRDGYAAQKAADAAAGADGAHGMEDTPGDNAAGISLNPEEPKKLSKSAKKKIREKKRKEKFVSASESRRLKRINEKMHDTTCFACREKGHAAKDCPSNKSGGDGVEAGRATAVGICYRCGSKNHTLSKCKKPANAEDPYPYASCFVCNGKGHLASACPQNKSKGVYPNGGCCKLCGETSHLARDCTVRTKVVDPSVLVGSGCEAGADEDDFHIIKRTTVELDRSERHEDKMKHMLTVQTGVLSGKAVILSNIPPVRKKVVVFK